jgi:hypothetical protein
MDQSVVTSPNGTARMWIVQWLAELNLFESNTTEDRNLQIQRWSTRLYIIALSFSIIIICTLVEIVPQHVEIQNPTLKWYEKLQDEYSPKCPCSNVSIPYEQFVQFEPSYHQVCSSDFITQRWIDYLYNSTTTPFYHHMDFRLTASQQFQLLAILCRLSAQAINASLRSFNNTKLITAQLLSKNLFDAQIQAHIHAFKITTLNKFNHTLGFVRHLFFSNNLLPAAHTFFILDFPYLPGSWPPKMKYDCFYHLNRYCCYCFIESTCKAQAGFLGDEIYDMHNHENVYAYQDILDGWYIGCLPIDSLFFSTLKSFYNQTALDSFSRFFSNSSGNFTCLNANQRTIFFPSNTTLETIIKANFIEQWGNKTNYASYFNMCAPKSCAYTISKRFNSLYSISFVLGLYCGLSTILCFLIPMIIKWVLSRKQNLPRTENTSSWLQKFKRALFQLNLFKSSMHVEPRDINQQQWSTRFYIIFLVLTLTTISLHLMVKKIQTDLPKISFEKWSDLQKQQSSSSSLQCPCSQLSVSYKHFIKFNPIYHEVCSSEYAFELQRLAQIFTAHLPSNLNFNGFRTSGSIFRVLQSFCKLASTTVTNAVDEFYETQLVTKNLLAPELFESHINSSVTYFKSVTPNWFSDILMLIRETTRTNQFIHLVPTNYRLVLRNDLGHMKANLMIIDQFWDISNRSCSGILNRDCKTQYIVDVFPSPFYSSILLEVDGFYSSFYPVEALLLSQLQSLYNTTFMHLLGTTWNENHNFKVLSQPSHFPVNSTSASLVNELFIESWGTEFNYTAYFEQCQPFTCSYSKRLHIWTVILTVVSLFGGLSILFRLVTPFIVSLVLARCHKQMLQEAPPEVVQRPTQGKKDPKYIIVIGQLHY